MSTVSVPLTKELEAFIEHQIITGNGETKAGLIRKAITRMEEDFYIQEIFEAERELKEGKIVRGNLRDLV